MIDTFYVRRKVEKVTISPKFQVVIPKQIRENLKLKPGQKLLVIQIGERIEFVIEKDVKSMRGFLSGMDTTFEREQDRL